MTSDSPMSRLERTMVGREKSTHRQLVRAITVVTIALVLAWLLTRLGVFGLDTDLAPLFATAAGSPSRPTL